MTTENNPTLKPESVEEPIKDEPKDESCPLKKSRFSPAAKGALIGAVAGSILPVFGTISGAIIGAIGGKVYEKKCLNKPKR